MSRLFAFAMVLVVLCLAGLTGCSPTDSGSGKPGSGGAAAHDHDHDHGPAGPHGGHTESFDQDGYAFEWIHDDAKQLVRVVILDTEKKNAVPVKAESITITSEAGQSPQTYTLAAVAPDADGKTAEFELKDGGLIVALGLGVNLSIDIDGTTYTKKLEAHDHHDD